MATSTGATYPWADGPPSLLLSTRGAFSLSGPVDGFFAPLYVFDEDVFRFDPDSLGTATSGSFEELVLNGSQYGLSSSNINAVHVEYAALVSYTIPLSVNRNQANADAAASVAAGATVSYAQATRGRFPERQPNVDGNPRDRN